MYLLYQEQTSLHTPILFSFTYQPILLLFVWLEAICLFQQEEEETQFLKEE